tara:strand:- start:207 stop:464 length:258 start_codon:yes stop_codon:yes gene_type:complete
VELPIVERVEAEETLVKIQLNEQVDREVPVEEVIPVQHLDVEMLEDILPLKVIQDHPDQDQVIQVILVELVEQEPQVQIHVVEQV